MDFIDARLGADELSLVIVVQDRVAGGLHLARSPNLESLGSMYGSPSLSADGRRVYLVVGPEGGRAIMQWERPSTTEPFGPAKVLAQGAYGPIVRLLSVTSDESALYARVDAVDAGTPFGMLQAARTAAGDPPQFGIPDLLSIEGDTKGDVSITGLAVAKDGTSFYFGSSRDIGNIDTFVATRASLLSAMGIRASSRVFRV